MADKMEPVAYTDKTELKAVKDGNGLMWPGPIPTISEPDGETALYTADQVKELTEMLEKAESRLCFDPGGGDKIDELESAMGHAEASLAEARKVIEPFAKARARSPQYFREYIYGEHADAALAWLQANKGDA